MTGRLDQAGANRFTCALAPACSSYARVTIADTEGDTARACPQHAVAALNGIIGARVIWADTRGINDHERTTLSIAGERSQLVAGPRRSRSGHAWATSHEHSRLSAATHEHSAQRASRNVTPSRSFPSPPTFQAGGGALRRVGSSRRPQPPGWR
jgi:hypothetical protein